MKKKPYVAPSLEVVYSKVATAAAKHRKSVRIRCNMSELESVLAKQFDKQPWIKEIRSYTKGNKTFKRAVYICPNCSAQFIQPKSLCNRCGAVLITEKEN